MPCGNLLTQRVTKPLLLKLSKPSLILRILVKPLEDGTPLLISDKLLPEDQPKTISNQPLNNQFNKLLPNGFKLTKLDTFSTGSQPTNTGMLTINSTMTQPHLCIMMLTTTLTLPSKSPVNKLLKL